jgi:hypothetical protein
MIEKIVKDKRNVRNSKEDSMDNNDVRLRSFFVDWANSEYRRPFSTISGEGVEIVKEFFGRSIGIID